MTTTDTPATRRRQHTERKASPKTARDLAAAALAVMEAEDALTKLKAKRDALIVKRYQEGGTFRGISTECGVSRPRVEQIIRAAGIEPGNG